MFNDRIQSNYQKDVVLERLKSRIDELRKSKMHENQSLNTQNALDEMD